MKKVLEQFVVLPLQRQDLPKRRYSGNSLHIRVLYKGSIRFICHINFADDQLCWLEEGKGVPVEISKLKLLVSEKAYQRRLMKKFIW